MSKAMENTLKHLGIGVQEWMMKHTMEAWNLEEVLGLVDVMPSLPSVENMIQLMQRCMKVRSLSCAKRISVIIHQHGLLSDLSIGNNLVQMLVVCKDLSNAQDVFEKLPQRKEFAWTSLIQGYIDNGDALQTLALYDRMQEAGVHSTMYIYPSLFKACARLKSLYKGRQVHAECVAKGFELDLYIGNSLVDLYAKCGVLSDAQQLFKRQRVKNTISWNVLIAAHVELGESEEALEFLMQMKMEGLHPDAGTFVCSLKACAIGNLISKGLQLHLWIVKKGWDRILLIANSLVNMYAKCSHLQEAWKLLNHLSSPSLEAWTAIISGYAEQGFAMEALNCCKHMQMVGLYPDDITFVCCLKACSSVRALSGGQEIHLEVVKIGLEKGYLIGCIMVDMYAKCGLLEDAQKSFDELLSRNVVSWTALIAGYVEHGHGDVALKFLQRMQEESITPNAATYTCIIRACSSMGVVDQGRYIHTGLAGNQKYVCNLVPLHVHTGNNQIDCHLQGSEEEITGALIDMYSRFGHLLDAKGVFDAAKSTSLITCNTLIMGCSRQGESTLVAQLVKRMKKEEIAPDGITFLGVLTTCSHDGLIDIANRYYLDLIESFINYSTVEHCNCMIDLCSRAGQHVQALFVLERMPFQPNLISFSSMMSACRSRYLVELGKQLLDGACPMGRDLVPVLISMSNIYAMAHMWDEVDNITTVIQAWKGL
ncbi:hypothetical protein KP509_08G028800 [Ceratopteris richardii]|uniref:Pentatricopeptide repeat-containing protein n=1 Tax=Ceratopteris richardii TaxID=49495 RepID=A0A8T2U5L8_CERRI|nr:hypothetical protein KP509_08G028800 [Ceratopteris richardii]KAH7431076.1 hypothetical protein KP509_08G028800 [Ceratopteris richardii]KAH7431077.1 hypothetical protein KP509_08G028800 [Ceratopteris richardii]